MFGHLSSSTLATCSGFHSSMVKLFETTRTPGFMSRILGAKFEIEVVPQEERNHSRPGEVNLEEVGMDEFRFVRHTFPRLNISCQYLHLAQAGNIFFKSEPYLGHISIHFMTQTKKGRVII